MSRELIPGVYWVETPGCADEIRIDLCEFFAFAGLPQTRANCSAVLSAVQTTLQRLAGAVQVELVGGFEVETGVIPCR